MDYPASARVPSEVWVEILDGIPEDETKSIQNLSLTCWTLRHVARPRLFSVLHFITYALSHGGVRLCSPEEVQRRLARLDFLTSPEIAPLVRYLNITSWTGWSMKPSEDPGSPEALQALRESIKHVIDGDDPWSFPDNPYILFDALFQRLGLFTGLEGIRADSLRFTQASVDILCRLPKLSELCIWWCGVAPGQSIRPTPRVLHVSRFTLMHNHSPEMLNDHWLPLLHPDHLRVLWLDLSDTAPCPYPFVPSISGSTFPSFPHVHKLIATTDLCYDEENWTVMSKFPAVRVFKLLDKAPDVGSAQISAVFPRLSEYSGPPQALPVFRPARGLTRLDIARCHPDALIPRIEHMNNITSLCVTFKNINTSEFNKLMSLLPKLTELFIRVDVSKTSKMFEGKTADRGALADGAVIVDENHKAVKDLQPGQKIRFGFKPATFFQNLRTAPSLSPALERLAISWECDLDEYEGLSAYTVPDLLSLRDALRARCPQLTALWLDGFYFKCDWRDPPSSQRLTRKYFARCLDAKKFLGWEIDW
ncbi:hypothetical protein K438DRAFT_1875094 [Mycena galopus ATCC 62051]|nr:hypothetical protein K438DRAFT_1875094 [Mycena galopus ATCC 62051]